MHKKILSVQLSNQDEIVGDHVQFRNSFVNTRRFRDDVTLSRPEILLLELIYCRENDRNRQLRDYLVFFGSRWHRKKAMDQLENKLRTFTKVDIIKGDSP